MVHAQADDDEWYLSKVLAVSIEDYTVKVAYAGYSSEYEEWVSPERIRSRRLRPPVPKARPARARHDWVPVSSGSTEGVSQ